MKQTDVFDKLDNILNRWYVNDCDDLDVILIAEEVSEYLKKHPHPRDIVNENG